MDQMDYNIYQELGRIAANIENFNKKLDETIPEIKSISNITIENRSRISSLEQRFSVPGTVLKWTSTFIAIAGGGVAIWKVY